MSWKVELFRAIFVALGTMEIITNVKYLVKKDGLTEARKQHKELPNTVTDKNMKIKVICMLLSGIGFLFIGLASYILHSPIIICTSIFLMAFSCYALIEAIYYKYRNTFGFAAISIAIFALYIFVK